MCESLVRISAGATEEFSDKFWKFQGHFNISSHSSIFFKFTTYIRNVVGYNVRKFYENRSFEKKVGQYP